MTVWIGTSGWQYADWRGRLHPEGLPQRLWLEHYAERFACVEVNATFYQLPPGLRRDTDVLDEVLQSFPAGVRVAVEPRDRSWFEDDVRALLATWARRLADLVAEDEDGFVFLNNDTNGCAPRDARILAARLREVGLEPSRVPGPRETPVGP